VSDRDGLYFVEDVPPRRYAVRAGSKGFALHEDSSLLVRLGQDAKLDIPMEVGTQESSTPGRELFGIAYGPAGSLRQGSESPKGSRRPAC
jgi:hypothetical protein